MARQRPRLTSVGERLLASKLQVLSGSGRRPNLALGILTGRIDELPPVVPTADASPTGVAEEAAPRRRPGQRYAARTVYLSERHLRDIERIMAAWRGDGSERLNRSVVLRRAIEHLTATVDAEPAPLENA